MSPGKGNEMNLVTKAIAWICLMALPAAAQSQPSTAAPKAILIAVKQGGFLTKRYTLKAGTYHLFVENRTGVSSLIFDLEQVTGDPSIGVVNVLAGLLSAQALGATGHLTRTVALTPGWYRLRVPTRPTWLCTFQVQ